MAAGVLAKAGYFMGDQLIPADEANPKGYFEDMEVNSINEDILAQAIAAKPNGFLGEHFFARRPARYQRWLAPLPPGSHLSANNEVTDRIARLTARQPYCFKDPRFCYTLNIWRPYLAQIGYICVFRNPLATVTSMVKEARRDSMSRRVVFRFNERDALRVWCSMYEHVIKDEYRQDERWLFINYDQFIDGSALARVSALLGIETDDEFVDSKYQRSGTFSSVPHEAARIYERLCELSGLDRHQRREC
jgi:hypothetical protein